MLKSKIKSVRFCSLLWAVFLFQLPMPGHALMDMQTGRYKADTSDLTSRSSAINVTTSGTASAIFKFTRSRIGGNGIPYRYADGPLVKYVAMGDSITEGVGDNDPTDDVSMDGRNNGGGFEPILNDLLTLAKGVAHTVINEGIGGTTSADGLAAIHMILYEHPDAKGFLIQFGTNDARPWLPVPPGPGPGSFQENMQKIIGAITIAGKEAWVAKPPIALGNSYNSQPYNDPDNGPRSVLIKAYNQIIEYGLNNISKPSPDFYSFFSSVDPGTGNPRYQDQYADNLHPNGAGYRSMAQVWFQSLSQSSHPFSPPRPPDNLRIISGLFIHSKDMLSGNALFFQTTFGTSAAGCR